MNHPFRSDHEAAATLPPPRRSQDRDAAGVVFPEPSGPLDFGAVEVSIEAETAIMPDVATPTCGRHRERRSASIDGCPLVKERYMAMERDDAIRVAAQRRGLSEGAVAALWDALLRGRGRQAQFNHPDLGGMGQWSGGMVQIGDMFNAGLEARVAGACADLAAVIVEGGTAAARSEPWQRQRQDSSTPAAPPSSARAPVSENAPSEMGRMRPMAPIAPLDAGPDWWPVDLGRPSSSGAQNGIRYAVFPDRGRLAVERGGRVTLYDTGAHRIGGVSQEQSRVACLVFTSQDGPVDLDRLAIVDH